MPDALIFSLINALNTTGLFAVFLWRYCNLLVGLMYDLKSQTYYERDFFFTFDMFMTAFVHVKKFHHFNFSAVKLKAVISKVVVKKHISWRV